MSNIGAGGQPKDLLNFLRQQGEFRYSNQSTDNAALYFSVKTQAEAEGLRACNGITYNGKPLTIQIRQASLGTGEGGGGKKATPTEVARVLPNLLMANYNAELRLLNLAGLGAKTTSFRPEFNNPGFMKTLIRAIADTIPQVITINFEANRIKTLYGFSFFPFLLPAIENMSFEDNEITDVAEIEHLSKLKLHHVIFRGNPMCSDSRYEAEVRMHLTSINMVDSTPVAPLISFNVDASAVAASGVSAVPPSRESFFESPTQKQWVFDFLTKFFGCYDGNRNDLLRAYIDESLFTVTVSNYNFDRHNHQDGVGGRGGRGGKFQKGEQHNRMDQTLAKYLPHSRNLAKLKDREQVRSLVISGRVSIVHTFTQLPASRHSKDDMTIDAITLPTLGVAAQMILVTMHGHFWESQAFGSADGSNLAFDRSLILALAPPGSEAASNGWPAMIVNDQLHLRNYIIPASKLHGAIAASAASTSSSMGSMGSMGILQSQMIEKLMVTTKLRPQFARQCLEGVQYNYEAALQQFWSAHNSGQITPDMIMQ